MAETIRADQESGGQVKNRRGVVVLGQQRVEGLRIVVDGQMKLTLTKQERGQNEEKYRFYRDDSCLGTRTWNDVMTITNSATGAKIQY